MTPNSATIAISLPQESGKDIDSFATQSKQVAFKWRIPQNQEAIGHKPLAFDPLTGLPLVWFLLEAVGQAALDVALENLIEHLVKTIWERKTSNNVTEIMLRASNGSVRTLHLDREINAEELTAWIKQNGQR